MVLLQEASDEEAREEEAVNAGVLSSLTMMIGAKKVGSSGGGGVGLTLPAPTGASQGVVLAAGTTEEASIQIIESSSDEEPG